MLISKLEIMKYSSYYSQHTVGQRLYQKGEEDKEFSIYELDFSGKRSLVYQNKKKKQKSKTQLEAVVDYIKDFCEHTGIERLPSICMPPLPETIAYEQSEKKSGSEIWVNIGIVDEPGDITSRKNWN